MTEPTTLPTIDAALGARETFVEHDGLRTWVAIVGDEAAERDGGHLPLLLLHGGPGACHDYVESLAAISATGRRVIFYDQQGCGNSDQADDEGRWTVDFFVREVDAVRRALGLEGVHILGQSWGGMLLMEYLLRRPAGVASATIASSPASMPMWIAETGRLRAALPPDVIATLDRHDAAGPGMTSSMVRPSASSTSATCAGSFRSRSSSRGRSRSWSATRRSIAR